MPTSLFARQRRNENVEHVSLLLLAFFGIFFHFAREKKTRNEIIKNKTDFHRRFPFLLRIETNDEIFFATAALPIKTLRVNFFFSNSQLLRLRNVYAHKQDLTNYLLMQIRQDVSRVNPLPPPSLFSQPSDDEIPNLHSLSKTLIYVQKHTTVLRVLWGF